ncbi:MAG: nuclear transport factor 2 family protein [Streptosporangiaceae bacterium]
MVEASLVPEVVYTHPSSVSHGYDEVTGKMETTQRNFPGASFRNDKFVTHHGLAVSHWTMNDQQGAPIFTGVSFAAFAPDGRLQSMAGFFEPARDA